VWRNCDWFPLATIPELHPIVPPLPEPQVKVKEWRVSKFQFYASLVSAVAIIVYTLSQFLFRQDGNWILYLHSGIFITVTGSFDIYIAMRYVRQRQTSDPTV
jgi:hypothetical protein